MLKILIKKQLLEINRALFFDAKTGKRRSTAGIAFFVGLFVLFFVFLMAWFAFEAYFIGGVFLSKGLNWLFFAATGIIGMFFGIIGSVFNTYATLYIAKDNDLLLSMPIPVKSIILSRLASVYIIGAMYAGIVTLPSAVVYMALTGWAVKGIIGSLIFCVAVSLVVFVFSCGLGFIVAKLAGKLKNRGILTTILMLALMGAYYTIAANAEFILNKLTENGEAIAVAMRIYAYPLYSLGKVGEGDPIFSVCFLAATLLLTYLVYLVISRSFLKMVTSPEKTKSGKYDGKKTKSKSQFASLFKKELVRFTTSSAYMINCGLSSIFMIVIGIVALIKGWSIISDPELHELVSPYIALVIYLVPTVMASLNPITAPSISLEGKNIWILKSLPIDARKILGAKLLLHIVFTLPAVEFLTICLALFFKSELSIVIISVIISAAYVLCSAMFGLFLNLKRPNFRWTSESVAIKHCFALIIDSIAGIIFAFVIAYLYPLCIKVISPFMFGLILVLILSVPIALLFRYFNKKAAKDFADL